MSKYSGLNRDALRKMMDEADNSNKRRSRIWKPKIADGKSKADFKIRFLPYNHSDDKIPFRRLYFYYNITELLGERSSIVAPHHSYGEPDPIFDFLNHFRSETGKDPEAYKLYRKLQPQPRFYAPVLVRGEEEAGAQWWSFGKGVQKSIFDYILDDDMADINVEDPYDGVEFEVNIEKVPGKKWADVTLKPPARLKLSPLFGTAGKPDEEKIADVLKQVEDIKNVFPPKSKSEMDAILDKLRIRIENGLSFDDVGQEVGGVEEVVAEISTSSSSDDSGDAKLARLKALLSEDE